MSPPVAGLAPRWPVPASVRAFITFRTGGVSQGPFASFNLAHTVGDAPEAVRTNRERLRRGLGLPAKPAWLEQVHGADLALAGPEGPDRVRADAALVTAPGGVAAVLTADCLPVLLARGDGTAAAAVHGGWRGLAAGVLEAAVGALGAEETLYAFLGPAIGPGAYTVGEDVRSAFAGRSSGELMAFAPAGQGWKLNLYRLARNRLLHLGLSPGRISGGGFCTWTDRDRFFSHRRDRETGRMAALIWLEDERHRAVA